MKLKSAALSGGLWIILQQKLLGYASLKIHNGECYQIVTEHKKQPDESTVYDVSFEESISNRLFRYISKRSKDANK